MAESESHALPIPLLRFEQGEKRIEPPSLQASARIEFRPRFQSVPVVYAALSQIVVFEGARPALNVHVFVTNITVDGFTLNIHSSDQYQTYAANWFAIGS